MATQWPEDNKDRFLIQDRSGDQHGVSGYGFVSVSDIADMVSENAYATNIGEDEPHDFRVWRLTNDGPVPAKITVRAHRPIEQVEVILTWRLPVGGGRYETNSESGYYRMSEV